MPIRVPKLTLDRRSTTPARFYDIYWCEGGLMPTERAAHDYKVDSAVPDHVLHHPSIFGLEAKCLHFQSASPIGVHWQHLWRCLPLSMWP